MAINKSFPRGVYPITVVWRLELPDGTPYSLEGISYELFYRTAQGDVDITTSVIENEDRSALTWTLTKENQFYYGVYTPCLRLTNPSSGNEIAVITFRSAFQIDRNPNYKSSLVTSAFLDEETATITLTTVGQYDLFSKDVPIITAGSDGFLRTDGEILRDDQNVPVRWKPNIVVVEEIPSAEDAEESVIYRKIEGREFTDYTLIDGEVISVYGGATKTGEAKMSVVPAVGDTHAYGLKSVALGQTTIAGNPDKIIVERDDPRRGDEDAGYGAFASGIMSMAKGRAAFAEGENTEAIGAQSHAEGNHTKANGKVAHAEGSYTEANGEHSHAEGHETKANKRYSHAEGGNTIADGDYSHAEGKDTRTGKGASHAEGLGTETSNTAEHAEGKYNKSNTGTIHSVGIGTSATKRKNAFEVMDNGDIYAYGVGGYDGTKITGATTVQSKIKSIEDNKADKSEVNAVARSLASLETTVATKADRAELSSAISDHTQKIANITSRVDNLSANQVQYSGSIPASNVKEAIDNVVRYKAEQSQVDTLDSKINTKQEKLVSGENIKTINGQPILGSGNIEIQGGGGSDVIEIPYLTSASSPEEIQGVLNILVANPKGKFVVVDEKKLRNVVYVEDFSTVEVGFYSFNLIVGGGGYEWLEGISIQVLEAVSYYSVSNQTLRSQIPSISGLQKETYRQNVITNSTTNYPSSKGVIDYVSGQLTPINAALVNRPTYLDLLSVVGTKADKMRYDSTFDPGLINLECEPNTYYYITELLDNSHYIMVYTQVQPTDEVVIEFFTGATAPTLEWQDVAFWVGGDPVIEANKHYLVSVVKGIGIIVEV